MIQSYHFRFTINPWNTGKLIGPKPPLEQKHTWGHPTAARMASRARPGSFNHAIDTTLRISDVAAGGPI